MRVGWVGLGNMGLPMAKCVAKHHELHIFSRDQSKAQRMQQEHLQTAHIHDTVEHLAGTIQVLVVSLNAPDVSRSVLIEQAVPAAQSGTVLVDTSTVPRQLSVECGKVCSDAGLHFLDAPVSGGPTKAADGTLSVMVGGADEAVQKAQDVLQCFGSIYHMGGSGTGTAAKLVNQLLVGVHSIAACEGMLMAQQLGIEDTGKLLELLEASFGYSHVLKRNGTAIQQAMQSERQEAWKGTEQPLRNMVKDMGIVSQVLRDASLELPVTTAAARMHAEAGRKGLEDQDMAVPFTMLREDG